MIPEQNARELPEIPEDVRAGLEIHPVTTMDDVLALTLRAERMPAAIPVAPALTH